MFYNLLQREAEELDAVCGQIPECQLYKRLSEITFMQNSVSQLIEIRLESLPSMIWHYNDSCVVLLLDSGLRQAKLVQDIRGLQKLYGTYLDLEFDTDGRMRGHIIHGVQSLVVFPRVKQSSGLEQTFKTFLKSLKSSSWQMTDTCFIEADKRQAEWVAVAYICGDANMLSCC
jgi:hypothetical protein